LVPISRGDIDGKRLRPYQENPALFTTNYQFLLLWLGMHWAALANMIHTDFPAARAAYGEVTTEPRLADIGATLGLASKIYLEYGVACGALNDDTRTQYLAEWDSIIRDLLSASTSASQELDIVSLTREAISNALTAGMLEIAPDTTGFHAGMDGFFSSDYLWIQRNVFRRLLRQSCEDTQTACVLSEKAVLPELYARGMIERDEESGKNSFLKRTPAIPSLKVRPRMIAFVRSELKLDD
jgi:hypothetical protein